MPSANFYMEESTSGLAERVAKFIRENEETDPKENQNPEALKEALKIAYGLIQEILETSESDSWL